MKVQIILILAIILVSCNQENEYIKKEYNDPDKVLNIQDLDTNSIYLCLSPNTYKAVSISMDSAIVFNESNFVNDYVPARLVFSAKKKSNTISINVKIDGIIDTTFNQNLIGINKIMVGKNFDNIFYHKTNLEPMAWVVD